MGESVGSNPPPQCPTEDRRGLLFPIWEEGCSPPTPSSSTPRLAGTGKRPLSDITKCLGSVWKTEGSGLYDAALRVGCTLRNGQRCGMSQTAGKDEDVPSSPAQPVSRLATLCFLPFLSFQR